MTLDLPVPNIEPQALEVVSPGRLNEILSGVQKNFDFLSMQFPVQRGNLAAITGTPVAELPTTGLYVGRQILYRAAEGVVWHLVYTKESAEFPWNKIGGPPLTQEVAVAEGTKAVAYANLATLGPQLTLPLKGDYDIETATQSFGAATNAYMSYKINAALPTLADSIQQSNGGTAVVIGTRRRRKTGLAAGSVLLCQYFSETGAEVFFNFRRMTIDPIRVG